MKFILYFQFNYTLNVDEHSFRQMLILEFYEFGNWNVGQAGRSSTVEPGSVKYLGFFFLMKFL